MSFKILFCKYEFRSRIVISCFRYLDVRSKENCPRYVCHKQHFLTTWLNDHFRHRLRKDIRNIITLLPRDYFPPNIFSRCYNKNSKLKALFASLLTRFNYLLQSGFCFRPRDQSVVFFTLLFSPGGVQTRHFLDIFSTFLRNLLSRFLTMSGYYYQSHFRLSYGVGDEFVRDSPR